MMGAEPAILVNCTSRFTLSNSPRFLAASSTIRRLGGLAGQGRPTESESFLGAAVALGTGVAVGLELQAATTSASRTPIRARTFFIRPSPPLDNANNPNPVRLLVKY